jgi:hypothetical protein
MGLNLIVVLARADEIEPNVRADPMGEFVEIENQRVAAAQAFGVPLSRVHISVPYLTEKKRGFDLERQAYMLLDTALQAAVEFKTLGAEVQRGDGLGWGDEAGYLGRAMPTATSTSAAVLPTARSVSSPPVHRCRWQR